VIGVLIDVLGLHPLPGRDRSAGIGEDKIALERFVGSSLSRSLARHIRYERPVFAIWLDAPNRLNFDGLSLEVADRAINEIVLKVFLKPSEERTDAGVKEARTGGSRFAILKKCA
jgi:hypothetical protein